MNALNILGSILFGFGASLETKVLYDKILEEKPIDDKRKQMIQIGLVFMFLGEVIRQLGKEENK